MPLSYSQLKTYQSCPRQYEYSVIKKLSRGISSDESFGSSVHNCLKRFGEGELRTADSGQRTSENGQMEMFDDNRHVRRGGLSTINNRLSKLLEYWNQSFIIDTYESRVEADFHRKRGERLMKKFFEWWNTEKRQVVGIETSFKVDLGGVVLSGRVDRIEKFGPRTSDRELRVIDYKTTSPRSQSEVDADLQLSIYALACKELFGEYPEELVMLYLSEDGVVEVKTERSEGQLRDAIKQISSINQLIKGGEFKPRPSAEACRRCSYKGVCDVAAV